MATLSILRVQEALEYQLGRYGCRFVSNTTAVTGTFWRIECISDTVFSLLTAPDLDGSSSTITGVTFAAGTALTLRITAFTLTSGSVMAYKMDPTHSV